ncbi:MAG: ribonuclease H family protein [Lachnospiraceae bacterium]|nr:ribonuclease H family protein [Lachnospiraceae bacterium]
MAKKNYYAVWSGKKPGVYKSWDEAKEQVHGYPGAGYRGTATYEEAALLVKNNGAGSETAGEAEAEPELSEPYAFTDGSYNSATQVFGYGGFLVSDGVKHPIQGSSDDPELAASWNVAGETCGAIAAIELAKDLGLTELTIYYDYEGVKKWATGEWEAKKIVSQRYRDHVVSCGMDISFVHVKAHTGIPGNEEADRLAKEACGILDKEEE